MASEFTERVISIISAIPQGRVATYGAVARAAGNPRGARGVVWILSSSSRKANLPWHRVINSKGRIGLGPGDGYELQRAMLESEGVELDEDNRIDLSQRLWEALR